MRSAERVAWVGVAAALSSGCGHLWDDIDPRLDAEPACGGISLLASDFSGDLTANFDVDKRVSDSDGLLVTLPDKAPEDDWGLTSRLYFDMRGGRVFIEVPEVPNPMTTAYAQLSVRPVSGVNLDMIAMNGSLTASTFKSGGSTTLATVTYQAAQQLYWQIRDDSTLVHWETSPDGETWTEIASLRTADAPPLEFVKVRVAAGLSRGGEVEPGQAKFRDLNGGKMPLGIYCPIAQLTNDFSGKTIGDQWANTFQGDRSSVGVSHGALEFHLTDTEKDNVGCHSSTAYDLRGGAASVHLVEVPNPSADTYLIGFLNHDAANGTGWLLGGGSIAFGAFQDGTYVQIARLNYDSKAMAWLRVREAAGQTHYEGSADGKHWVTYAMHSDPIDLSSVDFELNAGTNSATNDPGIARLDDVNIVPP